jgi:hypothetical protein
MAEFVVRVISVYVDASDSCNVAAFQLGQTAIGTTITTRSWSIKVKGGRSYETRFSQFCAQEKTDVGPML